MNLQVVYCNYQTADLSLRERLAFSVGDELARAYGTLREMFPAAECVLLSTCNRVEVYTAQQNAEQAPTSEQLAQFLAEFHGIPARDLMNELIDEAGANAVRHLFRVASSLDSMVLGEPQIVSQIKDAYQLAQEHEACGPLIHAMFQGAIRVSSRVRSDTRLSEGRVSVASVAVGEFGKSIFDRFDDKLVLVVGAGEMAQETLRYLKHEGVGTVYIVNRSPEKAQQLASQIDGAEAHDFDELDRWMSQADVIVSATGSVQPIVSQDRFAPTRDANNRKPVFILDLGAPRDFDPAIADLDDNIFLYDVDDLEATCERNRKLRSREIERAESIIQEETERFMQELYHRATGPIVARLRSVWHETSVQEVERLKNKLPHLSEQDIVQIERTVERIVNKLLHPPLETLRDESRGGTPQGLLEALKRLFHLQE